MAENVQSIENLKIVQDDYDGKDISSLSDTPSEDGMSASELKARFDALVKTLMAVRFNDLIDYLGTSGANDIGASVPGLTGNTVGEILVSEKDYIDEHKDDEENPHKVTKEQVGLSNVENVEAFPLENVKTAIHDSNEEVPTSAAVLDYFSQIGGGDMLKTIYDPLGENKDVFAHERRTDNPHNVTAAQAGAATPADLAGYLPLSGGKMNGNITIEKESNSLVDLYNTSKNRRARLQVNNTDVTLVGFLNFLNDSNYVRIDLKPETQPKDTLLTLGVVASGKSITYKILGEHYLCPNGAGPHNATYCGKALGSAVTDEQWAAIAAGTFTDLYIGDYWTIGGINYRIAAFDYYLRSGDTDMTTHHVTLVPDTSMYNHVMNDTNITDGAYVGSKMYAEGLAQAKTTINNAFGAAHILKHRRYLQNAVTNGYSTGGSWYDSTVELMTEQNVYGGVIFGNCENGTAWPNLYTNDKSQYPLFAMRPDMISARNTFWLRDVASASYFCDVGSSGNASAGGASRSYGVRPAFSIKS